MNLPALRRRGATAFSLMLLVSALNAAPVSAGEPAAAGGVPDTQATLRGQCR